MVARLSRGFLVIFSVLLVLVGWQAATAMAYPISYPLASAGRVSLNVYDSQGHVVRELLHAAPRAAGANTEYWDGLDNAGAALPMGNYSWKLLCTPAGLAADFQMNIGGNYRYAGFFPYWGGAPPGNHGGVCTLAIDASGLYIGASSAENVPMLVKQTLDGTQRRWAADNPEPGIGPLGLASDGTTLFVLMNSGKVYKYNAITGAVVSNFTLTWNGSNPNRVAVVGGTLVVSYSGLNAIRWIDPATGTVLDTATVTAPKGLALDASGTVFVTTGTSIVKLTRADHTLVTVASGLTTPTALSVDRTTNDLFVFDSTPKQVKRYSATGALQQTYGVSGGRTYGLYVPQDFASIQDLVAKGGGTGFYLVENGMAPRRVALINQAGTLNQEWYGGQQWSPWISVQPDNPNVAWMMSEWGDFIRMTLDHTAKTWQVHSCYRQVGLGNGLVGYDANGGQWRVCVRDGITYLCAFGKPIVLKIDSTNWSVKCVTFASSSYAMTIPQWATNWLGGGKPVQYVDQNDDGFPQQHEVTGFPGNGRWGGGVPDDNLNYIMTDGTNIYRYDVVSWSACGAPTYGHFPNGEVVGEFPAGTVINNAACSFIYYDTASNALYTAINSQYGWWNNFFDSYMTKWTAGSTIPQWRVGRQGGDGYGNPPGKIGGFRNCLGVTHDCVVATDYNGGHIGGKHLGPPGTYVWDSDGLFVGGLFDTVNLNGHETNDYWLTSDNLAGCLYTYPNGEVLYFGSGENQGYLYRITGWEDWTRLTGELFVSSPSTANAGQGLVGTYYDNQDFTNLATQRVDDAVNFSWQNTIPTGTALTAAETYSVRWNGKITPNYGYAFTGHWGAGYGGTGALYGETMNTLVYGATCELKFRGASVAVISRKANGFGQMQVYIDDVYMTTVNLNSATEQFAAVYATNGLAADQDHTIRIRSLGSSVNIDYMTVDGYQIDACAGLPYTFYVNSEDGARLWVGGNLVANDWKDKSAAGEKSCTLNVRRQAYDLRLDFYQNTGNGTISLSWSCPFMSKQTVPTCCLYPGQEHAIQPREVAMSIPGVIECENYDGDGEGVSYHSLDGVNNPWLSLGVYRYGGMNITKLSHANVDTVGWSQQGNYQVEGVAGEWMKYTVNIAATSTYTINVCLSTGIFSYLGSDQSGGKFHIEIDGVNVTGSMTVPASTPTAPFAIVSKFGVPLTAGQHVVKLSVDSPIPGGSSLPYVAEFDSLEFVTDTVCVPPTFSPVPSSYATAQTVTISSATFGASFKYTTDGTDPKTSSTAQVGATVAVNANQTVRAYAYKSGLADSAVAIGDYVIQPEVLLTGTASFGAVDGGPLDHLYGIPAGAPNAATAFDTIVTTGLQIGDGNGAHQPYIRLTASLPYALTRVVVRTASAYSPLPFGAGTRIQGSNDGTAWTTLGTIDLNGPVGTRSVTAASLQHNTGYTSYRLASVTNDLNAVTIEFWGIPLGVASPVFSVTSGVYPTAQSITISSSTSGASLRYTTDGSTPTATTGTVYSAPVVISATTTLKALAYKTGLVDSAVATGAYTITGEILTGTASFGAVDGGALDHLYGMPSGAPNAATAFDTNVTTGLQIGDGNGAHQPYIRLALSLPHTLTRVVVRTASAYTLTFGAGTRIQGSNNGTTWTTLGTIDLNGAAGTHTVTAESLVNNTGYTTYRLASVTNDLNAVTIEFWGLTIPAVADPTFSPAPGAYSTAQNITITTASSGASIRYTTDGSTPTSSTGTVYSTPVGISSTTTLKAIAYKSGMADSGVTAGAYTFDTLLTGTASFGAVDGGALDHLYGIPSGAPNADTAFDGNAATGLQIGDGNGAHQPFIRLALASSHVLTRVVVTTASAYTLPFGAGTRIQGSNDGTTWTTLGTIDLNGAAGTHMVTAASLVNNTGYTNYRLASVTNDLNAVTIEYWGN